METVNDSLINGGEVVDAGIRGWKGEGELSLGHKSGSYFRELALQESKPLSLTLQDKQHII